MSLQDGAGKALGRRRTEKGGLRGDSTSKAVELGNAWTRDIETDGSGRRPLEAIYDCGTSQDKASAGK